MKKLIALAFLALAIAGVGMMTHTASTAEAYVQLKADGVVWKHEWRW